MTSALHIIVLTGTLAVLASAQDPKYCKLDSCHGKLHSACEYSVREPSRKCGKVISSGVSQADGIDDILKAHNDFRKRVASGQEKLGNPGPQPGSNNIKPLQWSGELAKIAQAWALQCDFNHDKCRNTADNTYVGQNLAWSSALGQKNANLTEMITGWYDEVKDVNRNLVKSYASTGGPVIGHYTQLVWGKTTHVGCGFVRYNNKGKWISQYLVCNYGPGGNIIGKPIY